MDNLEKFIFYGKIFSENEILQMLKCASSMKMERRTDSKHTKDSKGNRNISYDFNFNNLNYDDVIKKYIENIPNDYRPYLCDLFSKYNYVIDDKIVRYHENDLYEWHYDFSLGDKGFRCLSSITYLNDNYSGGETQFINKTFFPKRGNTLIFPSLWMFPHQGNPIISNNKIIYVCHFWISSMKIKKDAEYFKGRYL
jgi:hypothetical protein